MKVIETIDVTYTYPDGHQALHGVNFSAKKGEVVALLGANGCGKTTLLQHFNGLFKPTTGEIRLNGQVLSQWSSDHVLQKVGLVFQDPNDQLFAATVFEDVSYGPTNLGLPADIVKSRVEDALRRVEAWDLHSRRINSLSYGQKKKVAVAGVLAMEPELLILDEPTAGLDPRGASRLMHILYDLRKQGLTIVLSTHEVDVVPIYCNRVYVMSAGKMVLQGTPQEVFSRSDEIRTYNLRMPRIGHLMEVLREKDGFALPSLPLTVGEARQMVKQLHGEGEKYEGSTSGCGRGK